MKWLLLLTILFSGLAQAHHYIPPPNRSWLEATLHVQLKEGTRGQCPGPGCPTRLDGYGFTTLRNAVNECSRRYEVARVLGGSSDSLSPSFAGFVIQGATLNPESPDYYGGEEFAQFVQRLQEANPLLSETFIRGVILAGTWSGKYCSSPNFYSTTQIQQDVELIFTKQFSP